MKDTQGNNITETEFTKDIGHGVDTEDTLYTRFNKEFVNDDDGLLNIDKYDWERLIAFIKSEVNRDY